LKASQISLDSNISFLLKGSPGFGKTLAAASFAVEGPIYLAYFDKAKPVELLTYFTEKRFGSLAKKILDNIEYDIYGAHNVHEYLNKVINFTKDCRYFAFITDSVTSLTASAVNWSMGFRDPNKSKKDKVNKDAPLMIPDFDEYKVETSLVSQALDISRSLPCHIIWCAHPLPSIKIEGSGASIKVTKTNPIVTYGSKVAGMIPGNFTEIYNFSKTTDYTSGTSKLKYVVNTEAIGDDYAKSPLLGDYVKEFDITDKLFYHVWKDLIDKSRGIEPKKIGEILATSNLPNPFATTEAKQSTNQWKT
jgi:hypothetical protein